MSRYSDEELAALRRSWAETDADLRWVIANVRLGEEVRHWAIEYLDHNELGEAWEVLNDALAERTEPVATRMESARVRMGLPSSDIARTLTEQIS